MHILIIVCYEKSIVVVVIGWLYTLHVCSLLLSNTYETYKTSYYTSVVGTWF